MKIQPLCAQHYHGYACVLSLSSITASHRVYAGAPILSCVSKGVPGIFMDCHMMVAQPEKVRCTCMQLYVCLPHIPQWVDDIADAGGALYCFHIEATSKPLLLSTRVQRSQFHVSHRRPNITH